MKKIELVVTLDIMLARRKMTLSALSERTGIQLNNLSILKNGKAAVIKLDYLLRLCAVLNCTPNDILMIRDKKEREPMTVTWQFSGTVAKADIDTGESSDLATRW